LGVTFAAPFEHFCCVSSRLRVRFQRRRTRSLTEAHYSRSFATSRARMRRVPA
jgi:hypothetical protein